MGVIDDRVRGAGERSQDDDRQGVPDAPEPSEMIELFARSTVGTIDRSLPVVRIAYEAAAVDGEVAKHLQLNEEQRYLAQSFFVDVLHGKGFLRTDIPIEELKRGFWLLAAPQTLLTATDSGWTTTTYVTWLTAAVTGLLLPRET